MNLVNYHGITDNLGYFSENTRNGGRFPPMGEFTLFHCNFRCFGGSLDPEKRKLTNLSNF